jgi:hypothetical protein
MMPPILDRRTTRRPGRTLALSPLAADALDVVAELTEAGAPPSLEELSDELDADGCSVRAAILAIRKMGFVEPVTGRDGAPRWRALLRARRCPNLEVVGTFDAPELAAMVYR